jgi:hypothetical protein
MQPRRSLARFLPAWYRFHSLTVHLPADYDSINWRYSTISSAAATHISWPQLYIKRTHVFIGIHYPACAEETAPFNWITDALAFKYLIVPSSSIPACSPLQKVAECSQFLASPNVISYHRAYVFEFFRLRAVSKHWAFYKQGQLLLRFYEVVLASSIWGLRRKHTYMGIF